MPLGLIVLVALALVVLFGAAHRALDRMHLTDTHALLALGLIFVGSFIDVPITGGRTNVSVNVGGTVIPAVLAVYVLSRAGTAGERYRGVAAALVTAGVIWGIARLTDFGPHGGTRVVIDPLWLFAMIGGFVAYVLGRSRRAAFVAGVLGVILYQLFDLVLQIRSGSPATLSLGGAGFFDAVILSGVISVGLAEVMGETRERVQGGPTSAGRSPALLKALQNEDGGEESGGDRDA